MQPPSEPMRKRFINYPEPLEVTRHVPPVAQVKKNPVLVGIVLLISAKLMEWLGVLRRHIWNNTGFNRLNKLDETLLDYEPRYEPTVIPLESEEVAKGAAAPLENEILPRVKSGYYSASDFHRMYLAGEITPTTVAKALLPLIRRDTTPQGPHSLAWFDSQVDRVLAAAEASTQRYRSGCPLGPLDGVPTAVKDEYDLEGYTTCLGSPNDYTSPPESGVPAVSWCALKLQESGAVILGKTSMHEFGLDTTGNNPHYGTPRNPYNSSYYTGGSSSGSAYVVAAGLVPMALGSDGGGSIRIPSSFCGVYGLKPSHNRLSFRPGPNHAITCAVNGPIASDMASLVAMFETVSVPHPGSSFSPMARFTMSPAIPDAKLIGIDETWNALADPANRQLCDAVVARLVAEKGYTVVPIRIPYATDGQIAHALTVLTDAATLLPEYQNLSAPNRILLALGRTSSAVDYLMAQKLRGLLMQHLAHLWKKHPGLMIASPVTGCAGWPIRSETELKHGLNDGDTTLVSMQYTWLANFCGLPAISLPAGYVVPEGEVDAGRVADEHTLGKIPVGFMCAGEWGSEHALMRLGFDVEDLFAKTRTRAQAWEDVMQLAKEEMGGSGVLVDV
ncbi:Fatty acid amide hydrolase [Ceratocystis platani]|uniref:Fatty acid amide hydrolase n=1 Tax=Ceratocystis fimbriata f. sp. platani TaxID=88771 RepID=A0A0F8B128_CERFI|nr:Fatty acid amide hydrolase [Ceratocystis platani]